MNTLVSLKQNITAMKKTRSSPSSVQVLFALERAVEEIERLQQKNETLQQLYADDCEKLRIEIEQLQKEVALWKDRCEAERQAHEVTIEHWNNERRRNDF